MADGAAAAAAAGTFLPLAGMGVLDQDTTQPWISNHLQPTEPQMNHLFQHVYPTLNQVFDICHLTPCQKYAVLRWVTNISDLRMLGNSVETIWDTIKHFNNLSDAHGGTKFGAIRYTWIHALMSMYKLRRLNQAPDAAGFMDATMNAYIMNSVVGEVHGDALDMVDLPKLGKNNFHQWEEAVLAQLQAKKGNLDIPLVYVVQKPTPPSTYVDETECLVYEAKCTGPGWEQDKKTIGNYIIRLLAQSNAKTWINAHLTAQVEHIVQYACTKHDKATFWLQDIYSFEHFSTDLQEAFTLLAE